MSGCGMQTFNNVTGDVWKCCCAKAQSYGVTINTPSGTAGSHGFTVKWNYNAQAATLQIQVTDAPWWAPCSTINGKVHEAVEACYKQHDQAVGAMIEHS